MKLLPIFLIMLLIGTCSGEIYKRQVQEDLFYISGLNIGNDMYNLNNNDIIELNKEVINLTDKYNIKNIIPINGLYNGYTEAAGITLAYWVFVEEKV